MDPKRRVVVTGMGIVSGLGTSLDEVSASLRAGKSCIREIPERVELGFRCPLSGVLPEIDTKKYFKRKVLKSMNEGTQYGAIATMKMFDECSIDPSILATDRAGVIFGNDSSAESCELVFDNVSMVAADTNNKNHKEWIGGMQSRSGIYVVINEDDSALGWSRRKPGDEQLARLGHYLKGLNSENASYLDVTSTPYARDEHSYFKDTPVKKNAELKAMFAALFEGGRPEPKMKYRSDINAYEIK